MSDIAMIWSADGLRGDWVLAGHDLKSGDDLVTAVIISLFTDRLSHEDDFLTDGDPRGWVGDLGQDVIIGSRLWLLERAKLTPDIGPRARDMAKEALQWLIDDGIVIKFDITTQIVLPNRLDMQVTAYRRDGKQTAMNFIKSWQGV